MTTSIADLKYPTVYPNGTSRQSLREGYEAALIQIDAALKALSSVSPNSRDYYPQGDGAFQAAVAQHQSRFDAVWQVKLELEALASRLEE